MVTTETAPLPATPARGSQGRILIVDDEPNVVTALCNTLAERGYETQGCPTGADALAVLQQTDYDILLCDLMMPKMDGIMLLRQALEIDPNLIGILMTGHSSIHTAVEAMRAGAFDYVLKPLMLSGLLPVLERAMDVRRLRLDNLQLRETVAMYELSMAVAFTLNLDTLVRKVADAALQGCKAEEVAVLLPTPDGQELAVAVAYGQDQEALVGRRIPMAQGIAEWVAQHQELLLLQGTVTDPSFASLYPRPEIGSTVVVPLLVGGKLVGVLNAAQRRRAFTLGEVKLLNLLASIVAPALDSAQLHAQVRRAEEQLLRLNAELEQRVHERTAQLEAANAELEAFSYSISHDLRAPLRAMDGFSRLLLRDYAAQLPPDAQHYVQRVRDNAQRMGQLIDDLLAFSRLSRQPLTTRQVAPAELVHEVVEELRTEQGGRQIEVTIGDLPLCQADLALLKQVFVNLLTNALKFTRSRKVARIEIGCQVHDGQPVYFVTDNGVGFDMQYANKLFQVFQRLHGAQEYEGTGVGLALVQRIIHRHGGRVWATAEVENGATFFFTLAGGDSHGREARRDSVGRGQPG